MAESSPLPVVSCPSMFRVAIPTTSFPRFLRSRLGWGQSVSQAIYSERLMHENFLSWRRERESERERNSQFGTHKTLPGLGGTLHGTLSKLQSWRQGGTGHGSHGSRQGALTTLPFRSGGSHPHSRLETQMPDAATILHREFIRVQHQHLASLGTVHI